MWSHAMSHREVENQEDRDIEQELIKRIKVALYSHRNLEVNTL